MKKVLLPVMALLVAFVVTPVYAGGKKVAYTVAVADLGAGIFIGRGGGVLFADGTAGGNVVFSTENGQIIFHMHLTSWSEVEIDGMVLIDICHGVHEIKGVSGFPSSFCLSDSQLIPVTGTPMFMDLDGNGKDDLMFRVTPAN